MGMDACSLIILIMFPIRFFQSNNDSGFCGNFDNLWEWRIMNFDKEFDASGMSCPLPILKTKKALADMASGQVLKVLATDSGSVKDMQAFADQTGNALLSTDESNGKYTFFMKKK